MFPVDSLPAHYYEEREAAEAARKMAHMQEQQAKGQSVASQSGAKSAGQRPGLTGRSMSEAYLQHYQRQQQSMPRPASSTVLGNIFQGFVRTSSPPARVGAGGGSTSGATTPVSTPSAKLITQNDIEKLMAEKKKDADYVGSSPGWW